MKRIQITVLGLLVSTAVFATDCPKHSGEVAEGHSSVWKYQRAKIGSNVFVSRTFNKLTTESTCSVAIYRQNGHPFSQAKMWLRLNGKETYKAMYFDFEGGASNQDFFPCPSYDKLSFQFAFDFGGGRWDNNCGHDYRAELPRFAP